MKNTLFIIVINLFCYCSLFSQISLNKRTNSNIVNNQKTILKTNSGKSKNIKKVYITADISRFNSLVDSINTLKVKIKILKEIMYYNFNDTEVVKEHKILVDDMIRIDNQIKKCTIPETIKTLWIELNKKKEELTENEILIQEFKSQPNDSDYKQKEITLINKRINTNDTLIKKLKEKIDNETDWKKLKSLIQKNQKLIHKNNYYSDKIKTLKNKTKPFFPLIKRTLSYFKNIEDEITKYEDTISKYEDIKKTLYRNYTKNFLKYENIHFLNFNKAKSQALYDYIYGNKPDKNEDSTKNNQFNTLNNTGFNFGEKGGSLYSDILTGTIGFVRVKLGTTVSSIKDSVSGKTEEAFQRLISSGGNMILNMEYPLVYAHSRSDQFTFLSLLNFRGNADFPQFGTNTDTWAGSFSLGTTLYANVLLDKNNDLRFFAKFDLEIIGGTDTFNNNLFGDNFNKDYPDVFTFGKLSVGMVLFKNIQISFNIRTLSSERSLRKNDVIIGGSVLH